MTLLRAEGLSRSFLIPGARRATLREHALGWFRPRPLERLPVLEGVSLRLEQGETLGIMGRNGSGKSTLLRLLAGILPPDAGEVRRAGRITAILELGVGFHPELDAHDNVALLGGVMGLTLGEIRASRGDILDFAELRPFARLPLKHYSTGMAARLAYSVAFHAVREVLLLDEVLAVGDAGFRARCEARFRERRARGGAAVVVSHDPRIIEEFCDRAVFLERGRIAAQGPPAAVAAAYLRALLPGTER